MAFKKDNKIKSNFNRISIGLASPEVSVTAFSARGYSALQRTTSATAANTKESATEV